MCINKKWKKWERTNGCGNVKKKFLVVALSIHYSTHTRNIVRECAFSSPLSFHLYVFFSLNMVFTRNSIFIFKQILILQWVIRLIPVSWFRNFSFRDNLSTKAPLNHYGGLCFNMCNVTIEPADDCDIVMWKAMFD